MRVLVLIICSCFFMAYEADAQQPFSKKEHQYMIYEFMNEVMKDVGTHGKVYLEEKVRGNKCYETKTDRIFLDRIKLMDIKLLDAYLTQEDIAYMRSQANELLFKKWNSKQLGLEKLEVIPSSSARKEGKHQKAGLTLGTSLPFFSKDGKKAIFFMCRQNPSDGWDAIALYKKTEKGWELVTTKISMWHS